MIKKGNVVKIIILVALAVTILFSVNVLAGDYLSFQGNVDLNSQKLSSGGVVVEIWDGPDVAGSNMVYNTTDNYTGVGNVSSGKFDIMLGSEGVDLNLEYGRLYYIDLFVDGNNMNFSGQERQPFMSSIGTINASFLNASNGYTMGSLTVTNITASNIILNVSNGIDLIVANATGVDFDSGTLYVDPINNRVGIGTTAPGSTLDINSGTISNIAILEGDTTLTIRTDGGYGETLDIGTYFHHFKIDHLNNVYSFNYHDGSVAAAPIHVYNLGTPSATNFERAIIGWSSNTLNIDADYAGTGTGRNIAINKTLYVTNDSLVGIGTSTPSNTLNVVGDLNVTGSSYLGNLSFTDNATFIDSVNISEDLEAGGTLFVDGRNGNVRIGTMADGGANLYVEGTTSVMKLNNNNGAGNNFVSFNYNSGTGSYGNFQSQANALVLQGGYSGSFIQITPYNNGVYSAGLGLVVDTAGNVGIGTSTPSMLLDVNGDANLTGTTYIGNSTLYVNGSTASIVGNLDINANITGLPDTVLSSDGLMLYLPFDGDTKDYSGQGNDGTNDNATFNSSGKIGGAYQFNGRDLIDVGTPSTLQIPGAMTIAAWVLLNVKDATGTTIVSQLTSARSYQLHVDSSGQTNCYVSADGAALTSCTAGSTDISGAWHHVALVYEPSTYLRVYLDGELHTEDTASIPAGQTISSNNVIIGNRGDANIYGFNGSIDEVMVYNRSLTDAEIKQLYNTRTYLSQVRKSGGVMYGDLNIIDSSANSIFYANVTSGNVGIGTTTPGATLEVTNITASNIIFNVSNGIDLIVANATGVDFDAGTLYVDPINNKVGIGTTAPGQNLDIFSVGDTYVRILGGSNNNYGLLLARTDGANFWSIANNNGNTAQGAVSNLFSITSATSTTAFSIQQGGNVGIGTFMPSMTLDVNGDSNLTGKAYIGNSTLYVDGSSVGIGTSSPGATLEVTNTSAADVLLNVSYGRDDGADAIIVNQTGVAFNSSGIYLDLVNQRIGIGTTAPTEHLDIRAYDSGDSTVKITENGIVFNGAGMSKPWYNSNLDIGSDPTGATNGASTVSISMTSSGASAVSASYMDLANTHDQLRLYHRLWYGDLPELWGTGILFQASSMLGASTAQTDVARIEAYFSNVSLPESAFTIRTQDNSTRTLKERFQIDHQGNIGIGTEMNETGIGPGSKLDVKGNASLNDTLYVTNDGYVGIGTPNPTETLDVEGNFSVDNTTFFVDDINNRVGIGTTAPWKTFEVNGDIVVGPSYIGNSKLIFHANVDSSEGIVWRYVAADTGFSTGILTVNPSGGVSHDLAFFTGARGSGTTNAPERMRITKAGLVGINSTAPSAMLEVVNETGTLLNISNALNDILIVDASGNVTIGASGGTNEDLIVYGSVYYQDAHVEFSPMVLESADGEPIPICMKNSEGSWVGCMPDESNNWKCAPSNECDEKILRIKTTQKLTSEGVSNEEIDEKIKGLKKKFEDGKDLKTIKAEIKAEVGDMQVLNELDDTQPSFSLQSSSSEMNALATEINSLKSENEMLKSELCNKDNTYSWCVVEEQPIEEPVQETPAEETPVEQPSQEQPVEQIPLVNNAPVIDGFMPGVVPVMSVGDSQEFTVIVSDVDGDVLTVQWFVDDLPVADETLGAFTFTASDAGSFVVKVLVTDGKGYVTKEWALTVSGEPLQYGITGAATGVVSRGKASLLDWLKSLF